MKPRWMRNHTACPDCGYVLKYEADGFSDTPAARKQPELTEDAEPAEEPQVCFVFDCPKCKAHFTSEEFWQENHDKWSREMAEEEVPD